jgi:N-acyl-L-homoserine lactone synthetase
MLITDIRPQAARPAGHTLSPFRVIEADTPELRLACHRLRYRIYCLEQNFEPAAENPGGLERDSHDDHAVQALVIHKKSGMAAATVRLILPRPSRTAAPLPFLSFCDTVDILPRHGIAEISRFGASRRFHHLVNDDSVTTDALLACLMRGCVTLAAAHGISYLCALLEPALIRRVARLGVHFPAAGPLVEHHGLRQPSIICVADVLSHLADHSPEVWAAVTDHGQLRPAA